MSFAYLRILFFDKYAFDFFLSIGNLVLNSLLQPWQVFIPTWLHTKVALPSLENYKLLFTSGPTLVLWPPISLDFFHMPTVTHGKAR